jgi:hypothetical protein
MSDAYVRVSSLHAQRAKSISCSSEAVHAAVNIVRIDVNRFRVLARDRVGAPHFVDEKVSNDHKLCAGEKLQHAGAMAQRRRFVPGRGELRLSERTPKDVHVPSEAREFAESMARDGCCGAGRAGKRTAQFDDPQDIEPE